MTAAVEPTNPVFQMKHAIEITMRETKALSASTKKSVAEITSCCCLNKGTSSINVHFEKDGYTPGEQVRMIIEIDNTNCEVDVTSLNISVTNTVGLRSSQGSTSDTHHVFSKSVNGVPAGTKMVVKDLLKIGQLSYQGRLHPAI
jgi:dihydroorotate dehydrogenase